MQARIDELEKMYASLIAARTKMENTLMPQRVSDEDIAAIHEFRKTVLRGLDNPTIEDKRRMLQILHVQIVVTDYQAVAKCSFKGVTQLSHGGTKNQETTAPHVVITESFDLSAEHGWAARKRDLLAEKDKKAR